MPVCTFFGHHDCPGEIKLALREAVLDLIENQSVDLFYIGNNGSFDILACTVLRELKTIYPHIDYAVVLAYLPEKKEAYTFYHPEETLYPEGIERTPPRFAISWRNKWMLRQSDFVVTYITRPWGGAAQFAKMAERQGKHIISLPP